MDEIIAALETLENEGSFCAEQTLPASALRIHIEGVGPVKFPLAPGSVTSLIEVAQPARFGWRDQTLLDKRVRNSWEIPASHLKISDAGWKKALQSALDELAIDLGLPSRGRKGNALRAHLHNMLIYAPGQFFRPHQDTEKLPGMVATLIVVLPSAHEGGALIVDHQGEKRRFQGAPSGKKVKLIAFYADCHHQLKPVRKGYRVALTYNLTLGNADASESSAAFPAVQLATALRNYFDTPQKSLRHYFGTPQKPVTPAKWVYLLDHQYTQKSLGWKHLKNGDGLRGKVLAKVAQELNLDIYLALAEIQETWDAYPADDDWYSRGEEDWESDDDEDAEEGDADAGEHDNYELQSLIEDSVELRHWIDVRGKPIRRRDESVSSSELCLTTETKEFDPFESEYEGYMGNYGNTLERWYHRAAVVLVPRKRAASRKTGKRRSRYGRSRKGQPGRRAGYPRRS